MFRALRSARVASRSVRTYSTAVPHHAPAPKSDIYWIVSSIAVFVPAIFYLTSPPSDSHDAAHTVAHAVSHTTGKEEHAAPTHVEPEAEPEVVEEKVEEVVEPVVAEEKKEEVVEEKKEDSSLEDAAGKALASEE